MQTNLIAAVLSSFGIQECPRTDPIGLDISGIGRLTLEQGTQEIIISLAVPMPPANEEVLPHALRFANANNALPFPLWVGAYADFLVLITSVTEQMVSAERLIKAIPFLLAIQSNLFSPRFGA